jgi:hypothetical protein
LHLLTQLVPPGGNSWRAVQCAWAWPPIQAQMPVILSMYDLELSNPWIPDLQSLARHLGAETRIFRPTPGSV